MYKVNAHETELDVVETEGAEKVHIQWLLCEKNCGAPSFALRRFFVQPGGTTPFHTHDWEHEVYVLSGIGVAKTEDGETPVKRGDAILIKPNERHCFKNTGEAPLEFLCIVPNGPATEGH